MKVRFFRDGDEKDVSTLYMKCIESFEPVKVTPEFILESSMREDFKFLLAYVGEEFAGFTGCLYYSGVGRAEIGPIAVKQQYRRKGVASALTTSMLDYLRTHGIRRVSANVKASNKGAAAFFMNQGFHVEAYLRRYALDGADALQLTHYL